MNKIFKFSAAVFAAFFVMSVLFSSPKCASAEAQHEKHIRKSAELLTKMQRQSDSESLTDTLRSAKAVAIFPSTTQVGLGIGGMYGEGLVLVRGSNGSWLGPSFVSLTGGSIGFQIGAKSVGLVLVINNDNGLQVFTGGKSFKLGGDVSIAAGPVGRDASAATDSRVEASIYSYSMSKGLFAGVSLSGSTINVNGDANKAYWGRSTGASTALSRTAKGKKIAPLVAQLKKIDKRPK